MTNKTIKTAIVGCGGIAHVHANIIKQMDNVSLISCCDENFEVSKAFSEKYGCKAYRSLKELFAIKNSEMENFEIENSEIEKPDIVHICTPHYTHVPLSIYAISNDAHVLLEKPVASTLTDMRLLQRTLKGSNKQLAVCFQNRYNASVSYAKNLIDSGETGKIIGARAFLTWRRDDNYYLGNNWRGSKNTEGAGVLINQSIHTVDLLYFLLGKPTKIEGTVSNRSFKDKINVEDTAEATFYYGSENDNEIKVFFYATLGYSKDATVLIEIHCENMTLCIEGDELRIRRTDGISETVKLETVNLTKPQFGKDYWGASHGLIIRDFYSHIENGKHFPLDAIEGGIALEMIFNIINDKYSLNRA